MTNMPHRGEYVHIEAIGLCKVDGLVPDGKVKVTSPTAQRFLVQLVPAWRVCGVVEEEKGEA